MGGVYIYMGRRDVDAILWNVTYVHICLLVSDYYTCLKRFSKKEHVLFKCLFIMILCIMSYLIQMFVLIPYILSISKGAGSV